MTGPDVYESVLGLPPGPRPLNHYELLGLKLFEKSESVIAAAADQRVVDAEESVLASADHIRQVVAEIGLARTCLLNAQTKADYDRQLGQNILGDQSVPPGESAPIADESLLIDEPPDEPQFAPIPIDLIAAGRPMPGRKRKFRVWFWTFTLVEAICLAALLFYLRPVEPIVLPGLPVRGRAAAEQPNAVSPPVAQPAQRQQASVARAPAVDPFAPGPPAPAGGLYAPGDPFAPGADSDDGRAVLTEPDMTEEATAPPPGPADDTDAEPKRETPSQIRPRWPSEWTLHFAGDGDWTIDNEMLSLGPEEVKALASLHEQPLFTLREASTKKPIAALPFDNQGHLSGIAVAHLPKNDWRACLSYQNQVLQGGVMVLDVHRNCVWFAEYRNKGRSKLLCLCDDGFPVAVQIWRGKEFAAYLIELAEGRPVAREQKGLSTEQAARLAAALAELASIEGVIRDSERDWKAQFAEWWSKHDNALRTLSLKPIDEGQKQSLKAAYYKKLFDEQHAGLDKLLAQFETAPGDPAVHAP